MDDGASAIKQFLFTFENPAKVNYSGALNESCFCILTAAEKKKRKEEEDLDISRFKASGLNTYFVFPQSKMPPDKLCLAPSNCLVSEADISQLDKMQNFPSL